MSGECVYAFENKLTCVRCLGARAARRQLICIHIVLYMSKVSARSSEPKATRDSSILVSVIQTRGRLQIATL
jgi:hypothetical protein